MQLIHRKKIILSALLLQALCVLGQMNNPMYDNKRIHYGFTLAGGSTNFKINRSADFYKIDTLKGIDVQPFSGFTLGVLANVRLGEFFDFRVIPSISFAQRNVIYNFQNGPSTAKIESAYLELPLLIKYKSERHKNWRFYVIAGGVYSYDLASNKNADRKPNEAFLAVNNQNIGYQMGFGWDLYYPYFKFTPELKLTNGINNLLVKDGQIYSASLTSVFSRILNFHIYFE